MTSAARSAAAPARERIAAIARAAEPVLKQLVLAGPPVVDLLLTDTTIRPPDIDFVEDATLQLLSTAMIDRIGIDLQKGGFVRTARSARSDRWRLGDGHEVDLVQVRADDGDSAQVWLEYATLLTLPYTVDGRLTVRIAGGPAMLALECSGFADSKRTVLDSEHVERIVTLVAGRAELGREVAAAPPEVRSFVVEQLRRIVASDALQFVIERALPDAALLPQLAVRVQEKLSRLAC